MSYFTVRGVLVLYWTSCFTVRDVLGLLDESYFTVKGVLGLLEEMFHCKGCIRPIKRVVVL